MSKSRMAFGAVITDGAFGIGLAKEDERGYWAMPGFGRFPSFSDAARKADELNADLGLTAVEGAEIIASSMRVQNRKED